jgi:hypothetical protein
VFRAQKRDAEINIPTSPSTMRMSKLKIGGAIVALAVVAGLLRTRIRD